MAPISSSLTPGSCSPKTTCWGLTLSSPTGNTCATRREHVRGIIITHGHEDHTGALPYLLREINAPVYATRLTRGLIELKLKSDKLLDQTVIHTIKAGDNITVGPFQVGILSRLPQHPRRRGRGHHHARRADRPHGRFQVRPHAGGRQADRFCQAGRAGRARRAGAAFRQHQRRAARHHAFGARRRGRLRSGLSRRQGPHHRRHVRLAHQPHPASGERGRALQSQAGHHRAQHERKRQASRKSSAISTCPKICWSRSKKPGGCCPPKR